MNTEPAIILASEEMGREPFVRAVLERFAALFSRAQHLLIKPNFVSAEHYPTTTHPALLRAVIDWFQHHHGDMRQLSVGDGPALDRRLKRTHHAHPIVRTSANAGLAFRNFHDEPPERRWSERIASDGKALRIATLPATVDATISLPVLKSHNVCGMTGALKNQFGYLPQRTRLRLHATGSALHRTIARINAVARPTLWIVDAKTVMINAQERRWGGEPKRLGWLYAGCDPVALDCFGLTLLGTVDAARRAMAPKDIDHLDLSAKLGLGTLEHRVEMI